MGTRFFCGRNHAQEPHGFSRAESKSPPMSFRAQHFAYAKCEVESLLFAGATTLGKGTLAVPSATSFTLSFRA
jgi:hypothetical protein